MSSSLIIHQKGMAERLKAADCKSVYCLIFRGSNPLSYNKIVLRVISLSGRVFLLHRNGIGSSPVLPIIYIN